MCGQIQFRAIYADPILELYPFVSLEVSVPKNGLDKQLGEVRLGESVALIVKPDCDKDRRINIDATATMINDPFVFERLSPTSTDADSTSSMACSELPVEPTDGDEFEVYVVRRVDGRHFVHRDGTTLGELRSIVRDP